MLRCQNIAWKMYFREAGLPKSVSRNIASFNTSQHLLTLRSITTTLSFQTLKSARMSAPNQGRQSPDPENQTSDQAGTQAKPNDQGGAPAGSNDSKDASDKTKSGLESNPTHILEKAAQDKTAK
ncbi:hypothetical protein EJ05DRAFT_497557 [Pseudovirgaria hyperparasitica]|uniref:Uncharacterized protein n=1 Tax=Pseudovirgaria hyperparasitica TaxID=470096 RepID=A0A6A6WGA8_9PEZI|nr:uncharacterized protein EJ05DRAFT_497557 [Pseudovirgaria hyperparasitica]KAF2760986.1 hypothetical protein EJ05DRAFT_497557 [Pseudovirgaria hyperparasitica]